LKALRIRLFVRYPANRHTIINRYIETKDIQYFSYHWQFKKSFSRITIGIGFYGLAGFLSDFIPIISYRKFGFFFIIFQSSNKQKLEDASKRIC